MGLHDKITIATLQAKKRDKVPIVMLTAYDFPTAQIEEAAGVDCILVGDSAAQVVLGHNSTLPVSLEFMLTITAAVRRGAPKAYLVGDMPYLSYQVSPEDAIRNAGRFMAEAGCDCVKVEGDGRLAETVRRMSGATIPVMAHLGLLPQSVHRSGGYRAQGRTAAVAQKLIDDARRIEDAGASALLLEAVPPEPARIIAESTALPVFGCGAGPSCDGHVIVLHDMLGLGGGQVPRFVKIYGDVRSHLQTAVQAYVADVTSRKYPAAEHGYQMEAGESAKLKPAS